MTSLRLKRGTTAQINSYTGPPGELIVDTTSNQLRLHNGTTVGGVTVGSLTMTPIKTSVYTANANELVRINSAAGGFTITLPASPSDGAKISFIDVANQCSTNPVLVAANGKTILGDSTGISLDVNGAGLSLIFNELTNDWSRINMFSSSFAVVDTAQNITYVDDVFSAYTYTGNGSTQTINNGIDLAGKGGMVWTKSRTDTNDPDGVPWIRDTTRGITNRIATNSTNNSVLGSDVASVASNGFNLGFTNGDCNRNGNSVVSWTFRKAAKFFDVVTYTGNGANYRSINHSLGIRPGFVIIKRTDITGPWQVWARISTGEMATGSTFLLNATTQSNLTTTVSTHNATTFETYLSSNEYNVSGGTYVAYLFAHDPATDGLIQCGSYTGTGTSGNVITLGWEPQFILVKPVSLTDDWRIIDTSRGWPVDSTGAQKILKPNTGAIEGDQWNFVPTATGFVSTSVTNGNQSGQTYIYMAIRRPNKPPTLGSQVYEAAHYTGNGAIRTINTTFPVDLVAIARRSNPYGDGDSQPRWVDRLRGDHKTLNTSNPDAEITPTATTLGITSAGQTGFRLYASGGPTGYYLNVNTNPYAAWCFRRAPGVFDIVCYTGDSVSNRQISHNLGVSPELVIVKCRSAAGAGYGWAVRHYSLGVELRLETTTGDSAFDYIGGAAASYFTIVSADQSNNQSPNTYVAYLFASKAGISKVGSYTGNGTSLNVDCGFTSGARFILIKRTDSTGDWFVFDSVRGIVSGNDPHLSLNSTAAEVTTDDSIDPDNSGFIVNQVSATNINVNAGTYIFLAFA